MSRIGAAPRAAVSVSNARAEASRRNGAKSRGPYTPEGKARSGRNALKHGMRVQEHVVLPEEDAAEFADLEAALIEELAPVGALQAVLVRRVAVAAWRLAGPTGWPPKRGWGPVPQLGGQQVELFAERHFAGGGVGLALIRDGNGTRSFETLLRYRGAAMAEFWRALKTLKALQAEQAADTGLAPAAHATEARPPKAPPLAPAARRPLARPPRPNEPEHRVEYALPEAPARGHTLHEPATLWLPNEPQPRRKAVSAPTRSNLAPNEPEPRQNPASALAPPELTRGGSS